MKAWSLIYLLFATSCATTMLRKHYKLTVQSDNTGDLLIYNDTIYTTPVKLPVKRSRNDLKLTLKSDTISRTFRIKAVPNNTFIYGNLGGWYAAPLGHLIDLTTPKRFTYGRKIYLSIYDTASVVRPHIGPIPRIKKFFNQKLPRYVTKSYFRKPGQFHLTVSSPIVSIFYIKTNQGLTSRAGCLGLALGTEYYYNAQHYLAMNAGIAVDLPTPFPIPIDYADEPPHDAFSAMWVSITNNVEWGRLQLGYGLHYNWYYLETEDRIKNTDPSITELKALDTYRSQALGVTLQAYHNVFRHIKLGVVYRPTLLNIKPEVKFTYQHLVSLDFTFIIGR